MPKRPDSWTREQLLVALRLYARTPFGRLHTHNPDIIATAALLGRSPGALAMKACNFASLDPTHQRRDRKGLQNHSRADEALWNEFQGAPADVARQAEAAIAALSGTAIPREALEYEEPTGPTEDLRLARTRRLQGFFRDFVLASYNNRCAISGLAVPELLTASHIIPWSADEGRRTDPRNGLALNALLDRAFDRRLIAISADMRVLVSPRIERAGDTAQEIARWRGAPLAIPDRWGPDPEALRHHRELFEAAA